MGKTSFALNVLTDIALKQKKAAVMISLEMSSESIVDRIMSEVSSVPMYKITKGDLDNEDFAKMGEAMEVLGEAQIYIDDKGAFDCPRIKI